MAVQSPAELRQKKCLPCEGGVDPYNPEQAREQLKILDGWRLTHDGQRIRKDDWLILFYASGNRDEDVFDEPFRFRVDRHPNPHVGFGHGEHFCLGSHLARRSQRALFAELARRLEQVELAGEPEWIQSSFVVGLKRLPIRYRLARGA